MKKLAALIAVAVLLVGPAFGQAPLSCAWFFSPGFDGEPAGHSAGIIWDMNFPGIDQGYYDVGQEMMFDFSFSCTGNAFVDCPAFCLVVEVWDYVDLDAPDYIFSACADYGAFECGTAIATTASVSLYDSLLPAELNPDPMLPTLIEGHEYGVMWSLYMGTCADGQPGGPGFGTAVIGDWNSFTFYGDV